ncbi:cyclin-U4-1-like [Cucurbita pepo subsp. pepo]|uniref:cyclin-U4-1-like n=1 Tax=Cucurbita pepo subsp. pepo TaxID=3664 RepID=UPI000C9D2BCA|nr:cyclin-U4-1-like [Cucurbita pepo subsp. pepo]
MVEEESSSMMPKLITFLSSVLQRVAESNDDLVDDDSAIETQKNSAFHGLTRPSISLHTYLERIFKYANCSNSCFIVAYVYLDRFAQRQPLLPINSFNVHRLLITSVLVAAKFMDDLCYNNGFYARVGGISTKEINFLEVDFLFGLGFHLNVTPNTFHTYCSCLHKEMLLLKPPLSNSLLTSSETSLNKASHLSFEEDEASHHQNQHQVAA